MTYLLFCPFLCITMLYKAQYFLILKQEHLIFYKCFAKNCHALSEKYGSIYAFQAIE